MPEYTRSPWFDEIVGFLRDVQKGNIDAAGALADFLEERKCPEHRRKGVLLRRRYRVWQRDSRLGYEKATYTRMRGNNLPAQTALYRARRTQSWFNTSFLLYLRDKFGQGMYEASDPQNSEAYLSS